ncbi:hypothetical protein H072_4572 [Dactylellina haptotyla CBS 200.50]|uniref:Rad4 beta-hairpin domain-containing protein n=1 Tax=Dactylellina haptotyla (strain CBS 200.50) TaxID=1284197 RepID=S8AF27_DACHA|nr:hypothetical protein H072_4572 [Dactylellina haptotyla CBS 200.50]
MSRRSKVPSSKPRSSAAESSSGEPFNRFEDIPTEFKHMLAERVREEREASAAARAARLAQTAPQPSASAGPSTSAKRKKPLTRRTAAGPNLEETSPAKGVEPPSPIEHSTNGAQRKPLQNLEKAKLASPGPSSARGPMTKQTVITPPKSKTSAVNTPKRGPLTTTPPAMKPSTDSKPVQAAQDSDFEDSDDDDEFDDDSDVDWETVDLTNFKPAPAPVNTNKNEPVVFELSIPKPSKSKDSGRKGPTPVERKIRLGVHKVHLLCLLAHNRLRSQFCNDKETQNFLLRILEKRVVAELNDNSYQHSKVFKQGLSNAAAAFRRRYRITKPGIRKPLWGYMPPSYDKLCGDGDVEINEFRAAAKNLEGSRDMGAQLFCALLRRAGLDARMVCSLQPLSYLFKAKYSIDDEKRKSMVFMTEDPDDYETSDDDTDDGIFVGNVNKAYGGPGPQRPNWRLPPSNSRISMGGKKVKKKREKQILIHDPSLPIYWVEVFDVMSQLWVAVDPLGMGVVRNLGNFEPPQADFENEMSYVVAFDNKHKVRDITKKYVKSYNGLTRNLRVDGTLDGTKWWKKALRLYTVPAYMAPDRDQFENGIMEDRVLREGIPKSLSVMKNHPVFAIEEQLRQNEVIHPKVECGTMTGKNKKPIPVYRRQDVKQVKTATQWYMLGREIKAGEQPLKHKKVKKGRKLDDTVDLEEYEEPEDQETGMYAQSQTIIYRPEPCVGPIVPQNAYGNIDLYVPSMLPDGGVHIPHKMARIAGEFLGIGEFIADAVVGFDFRTGGRSTPVIKGIVAAEESEEAIWLMIHHIEKEEAEAANEERRLKSLNMWRNFLVKLRIKERVDEYAMDDAPEPALNKAAEEMDPCTPDSPDDSKEDGKENIETPASNIVKSDSYAGGGFFSDEIDIIAGLLSNEKVKKDREKIWQEYTAKKLAEVEERLLEEAATEKLFDSTDYNDYGSFLEEEDSGMKQDTHERSTNKGKGKAVESYGGGFLVDESEEPISGGFIIEEDQDFGGGGFMVDDDSPVGGGFLVENDDVGGGGFMVEEDGVGGGFIVEDEDLHINKHTNLSPKPAAPKRKLQDMDMGESKLLYDPSAYGEGFSDHEMTDQTRKQSRSSTPQIAGSLKRKAQYVEGEGGNVTKRTKSASPAAVVQSPPTPNIDFSQTQSESPIADIIMAAGTPNQLKIKASNISEEEDRCRKKSLSFSPPANDERDFPEDDIQDDEFEYSDAGWTSS